MNSIQPREAFNPAPAGTSNKSGSVAGSRETQAAARRLSLDVSITTTDGDSFVLSAERVAASAGVSYSASSAGNRTQLVAQSNNEASVSASRVAAALSGNVDAEEARDIADALKQLIKALGDTEKGHLAQAAHRTEKLSQLETIAQATASESDTVTREATVTWGGE